MSRPPNLRLYCAAADLPLLYQLLGDDLAFIVPDGVRRWRTTFDRPRQTQFQLSLWHVDGGPLQVTSADHKMPRPRSRTLGQAGWSSATPTMARPCHRPNAAQPTGGMMRSGWGSRQNGHIATQARTCFHCWSACRARKPTAPAACPTLHGSATGMPLSDNPPRKSPSGGGTGSSATSANARSRRRPAVPWARASPPFHMLSLREDRSTATLRVDRPERVCARQCAISMDRSRLARDCRRRHR